MPSGHHAAVMDTGVDTHQHRREVPGNTMDHTWYDSTSPVITETLSELPALHCLLPYLHTYTMDYSWYDSAMQIHIHTVHLMCICSRHKHKNAKKTNKKSTNWR